MAEAEPKLSEDEPWIRIADFSTFHRTGRVKIEDFGCRGAGRVRSGRAVHDTKAPWLSGEDEPRRGQPGKVASCRRTGGSLGSRSRTRTMTISCGLEK